MGEGQNCIAKALQCPIALFSLRPGWLTLTFYNQKDKNGYLVDQLFQTASHRGRKHPSLVWLLNGRGEN